MSKIALVFFPANAYLYEDENLQKEAKDNPSGILRNEATIQMRRAKRTLNKECQKTLDRIIDMLENISNEIGIKAGYSQNAGCSMCPCSPGYVISGPTRRFRKTAFYVDEKGRITNIVKDYD